MRMAVFVLEVGKNCFIFNPKQRIDVIGFHLFELFIQLFLLLDLPWIILLQVFMRLYLDIEKVQNGSVTSLTC